MQIFFTDFWAMFFKADWVGYLCQKFCFILTEKQTTQQNLETYKIASVGFEHEHLLFQSRCHSLKHTVKFWVVFIVLECSSSWSSLSVSFCGSLSVADCFSCQCASWTVVWWWTRFLMHVDQFWTHSGLPKTPYLYLFCSGFGCGSMNNLGEIKFRESCFGRILWDAISRCLEISLRVSL